MSDIERAGMLTGTAFLILAPYFARTEVAIRGS